jgi:hypothetical protein
MQYNTNITREALRALERANRRTARRKIHLAFAHALFTKATGGNVSILLAVDAQRLVPTAKSVRIPIRPLRPLLPSNLQWLTKGPIHALSIDGDSTAFMLSSEWEKLRTHTLAIALREPNSPEIAFLTPSDYVRALSYRDFPYVHGFEPFDPLGIDGAYADSLPLEIASETTKPLPEGPTNTK